MGPCIDYRWRLLYGFSNFFSSLDAEKRDGAEEFHINDYIDDRMTTQEYGENQHSMIKSEFSGA